MTNRQACGNKPQGSQTNGPSAAITNFGKPIWATVASWFPALTESGVFGKNLLVLADSSCKGGGNLCNGACPNPAMTTLGTPWKPKSERQYFSGGVRLNETRKTLATRPTRPGDQAMFATEAGQRSLHHLAVVLMTIAGADLNPAEAAGPEERQPAAPVEQVEPGKGQPDGAAPLQVESPQGRHPFRVMAAEDPLWKQDTPLAESWREYVHAIHKTIISDTAGEKDDERAQNFIYPWVDFLYEKHALGQSVDELPGLMLLIEERILDEVNDTGDAPEILRHAEMILRSLGLMEGHQEGSLGNNAPVNDNAVEFVLGRLFHAYYLAHQFSIIKIEQDKNGKYTEEYITNNKKNNVQGKEVVIDKRVEELGNGHKKVLTPRGDIMSGFNDYIIRSLLTTQRDAPSSNPEIIKSVLRYAEVVTGIPTSLELTSDPNALAKKTEAFKKSFELAMKEAKTDGGKVVVDIMKKGEMTSEDQKWMIKYLLEEKQKIPEVEKFLLETEIGRAVLRNMMQNVGTVYFVLDLLKLFPSDPENARWVIVQTTLTEPGSKELEELLGNLTAEEVPELIKLFQYKGGIRTDPFLSDSRVEMCVKVAIETGNTNGLLALYEDYFVQWSEHHGRDLGGKELPNPEEVFSSLAKGQIPPRMFNIRPQEVPQKVVVEAQRLLTAIRNLENGNPEKFKPMPLGEWQKRNEEQRQQQRKKAQEGLLRNNAPRQPKPRTPGPRNGNRGRIESGLVHALGSI